MKTLTRELISEMSTNELFVELAKRGAGLQNPDSVKRMLSQWTTCPHCGHRGPIDKDFGTRVMRGEVHPQSWCRRCRATRGRA